MDRAAADGRIGLTELRGTPVVLNVWASWSEPCFEEAPVLERGWREAGRQGALFLGLDMQDIRADARELLLEFSISYPNVREGDNGPRGAMGRRASRKRSSSAPGGRSSHVIGALTERQLRAGVARRGRPTQADEGGDRQPTC